jgi:hypothetical protein
VPYVWLVDGRHRIIVRYHALLSKQEKGVTKQERRLIAELTSMLVFAAGGGRLWPQLEATGMRLGR